MAQQTADLREIQGEPGQIIGVYPLIPGAQAWLLSFEFEGHTVGIRWDREARQLVFAGDEELLSPAARLFFDEVLAQAMEWLRPYL